MKTTFLLTAAFLGLFSGSPAWATTMICPAAAYCNGEVNGTINAWGISSISDSFTLSSSGTVTQVDLGAWLTEGDTFDSLEWTILSGGPDTSAGGTVVPDGTGIGTISVVQDLGDNVYGYDVQIESFTLNVSLSAGTYYLELSNPVDAIDFPVYWDENDGPSGNGSGSIAWESGTGYLSAANECGSISSGYCSESFAVYTAGSGVPEPGTLALGGGGILLLAGFLRRRRR